jgi:hypothetical protein
LERFQQDKQINNLFSVLFLSGITWKFWDKCLLTVYFVSKVTGECPNTLVFKTLGKNDRLPRVIDEDVKLPMKNARFISTTKFFLYSQETKVVVHLQSGRISKNSIDVL